MNIVKGIDRIALVLAILAAVIGFILGLGETKGRFKTKNPDYKTWKEKYDARIDYLEKEAAKRLGQKKAREFLVEKYLMQEEFKEEDPILRNIISSRPTKYWYPPLYKSIIGGLITASLFFLVVLFSICGMTRGIKRFFLWIIRGFSDE
jgi:hypothetical protein